MPNGTIPKALAKGRTLREDLLLGFRFRVDFLGGREGQKPLDIRFQSVSGISAEVETTHFHEGGEILSSLLLPDRIKHENLTLKRGLVVDSRLSDQFDDAMSLFKFAPSNVLVTLLGESQDRIAAWLFMKAYPVKWTVSDLDASSEPSIVIETLELAYTRLRVMRDYAG
jgi:phage tail-like protein